MLKPIQHILERLTASGAVKFWRLSQQREVRREFYLMSDDSGPILDQDRSVEIETVKIEVWVARPTHQGYAKKNIVVGQDLEEQISQTIAQASLSQEKIWGPPANFDEFDSQSLQVSAFNQDLNRGAEKLLEKLEQAIRQTNGLFNSSELFCSDIQNVLLTSQGFERISTDSRLYVEICFSSQKNNESQELLLTQWAARPEDLNLHEMCQDSASGAEALLTAEPLVGGRYVVLLKGPVLLEIFHDLSSHLDARASYYQTPFKSPGETVIENYHGEDFVLGWDPAHPGALSSHRDDGWGGRLKTVDLVRGARVMDVGCSVQMAQYLGRSPQTDRGCLVLKASGRSRKELLQGQSVLEVIQFSGLFTSATDLTFSSEIRLARLWNPDGTSVYVKGGSLSGSFREHFKKMQLSDRKSIFNRFHEPQALSYFGPDHALIHHVPVSG